MAFTQSTFAPVGPQSTDAPSVYSYQTSDSVLIVAGAGYFSSKRYQLNENDIILAETSNGFSILAISSDTSTASIKVDEGAVEDTVNPTFSPRVQADWDAIGTDMGSYIQLPDNAWYFISGLDNDPSTFSKQLRPGVENLFYSTAVNQGVLKYTGTGVGIYVDSQSCTFRRLNYDGDGTNTAFEVANGGGFFSTIIDRCLFDEFSNLGTFAVGTGFCDIEQVNYTNIGTGFVFTGTGNGLLLIRGGGGSAVNTCIDLGSSVFQDIEITETRAFLASPTSIYLDGAANGANIGLGVGFFDKNDIKLFDAGAKILGANMTEADDNWVYKTNKGLTNSAWIGSFQYGDPTGTLIALTQNVPALIDVVTVEDTTVAQRLRMTANSRITNESETVVIISVTYVVTLNKAGGGGDQEMEFCLVKDGVSGTPIFCKEIEVGGTQADSVIAATLQLSPGEYLEPWITNTDNSDDVNVFGLTCSAFRVDS